MDKFRHWHTSTTDVSVGPLVRTYQPPTGNVPEEHPAADRAESLNVGCVLRPGAVQKERQTSVTRQIPIHTSVSRSGTPEV